MNIESIFEGEGTLLPADQQNALIAVIRGSEEGDTNVAFMTLASSHAKTFRKQRGLAIKAGVEKEEAESLIVAGFMEAVAAHDGENFSGKFAGLVRSKVTETLDAYYAEHNTPFTISRTHYGRYKTLMNEGAARAAREQKPEKAFEFAYAASESDPDIKPSTFLAIHRAVQGTSLDASTATEDGETGYHESSKTRPVTRIVEDEFAEAEDAVLVRAAFDAVNDEEERIIALHYGFRGVKRDDLGVNYAQGEVVPDAVIAKVLGSSQPTVNRKRAKGLTKMRKALGGSDD